ncbi:acylphosphatase [Thermodesulfitimonas autotrophica]|jgi:acylphosphatase|uniref:Acylphosphatase n=1 Tax=Thermodesulfitimonas autotrophica TaxID=1894989 RepID=A0A3N5AY74_9THEO|nr:acylphosphatase [Thermodesulfitimonas autotrophica]RPF49917.1 acylphosphatase [Thermodesulfitimonas autotrophica]
MPQARAHVIVRGKVQGVYFRGYTQQEALAAGVTGWVRNLPDGSVEAVFEGEREAVERLVAWCHKGSPAARVMEVKVTWEDWRGEFNGFAIRR